MARAKEKRKIGTEETIEGIFRTVGSFLDILSDMVQKGEIRITRKGNTEYGERKGMKAAAIYGFSVSLGDPQSGTQPFLEVRSHEDTGHLAEQVHEMEDDVFDEKETVVVVAELPGASGKDITVEVRRYPNNHY
jgi:HSP20 family protein